MSLNDLRGSLPPREGPAKSGFLGCWVCLGAAGAQTCRGP